MSTSSRQTIKSTPFRPTNYPARQRTKHVVPDDSATTSSFLESVSTLSVSTTKPNERESSYGTVEAKVIANADSFSPPLPPHMTAERLDDQAINNAYAAQRAMRYIPPSQSEPPRSFAQHTSTAGDGARPDPFAKTAILNARPGEASKQDLDDWFADPHTEVFVSEGAIPPRQTTTTPSEPSYTRSERTPIGRQPQFHPRTERCDEMAAKARMLQPVVGGRSKKDQLGSVPDSWGPSEEKFAGMFAIEEDPPSRSTSPFKDEGAGMIMRDSRDELREAKSVSLMLARAGTVYEGGRQRSRYGHQATTTGDEESWPIEAIDRFQNPTSGSLEVALHPSMANGRAKRAQQSNMSDDIQPDSTSSRPSGSVREQVLVERRKQLQGYRQVLSTRDIESAQ